MEIDKLAETGQVSVDVVVFRRATKEVKHDKLVIVRAGLLREELALRYQLINAPVRINEVPDIPLDLWPRITSPTSR